ncbi:unnamed protein product [Ilex paraguariensis]|uniref:Peptidase A1 domain-containing protein n=1 Tax=Ilex paraguariensis TaxID=185542 RepID=A0ABC8UFA0_9AQUA
MNNMMKCRRGRSSISLIILLCLVNDFINVSEGGDQSHIMRFELIHRHSTRLEEMGKPFGGGRRPKTTPLLERIRELLHSDILRQQTISHEQHLRSSTAKAIRRKALEATSNNSSTNLIPSSSRNKNGIASIEMPMSSGADYGTGQYLVVLNVGTPPQKLMLIADTGSDLTWMNCDYRCRGGGPKCMSSLTSHHRKRRVFHADHSHHRKRRVFHADHSASFRTVPCSSTMCKIEFMNLFSLARCPSSLTPCAYDYRYSDGSAALGFFAKETVTVSLSDIKKMRLQDLLIGCSESLRGQSFREADGVMGLGYSNYSFALKAADKFGGKFSYCLVDHLSPKNVSNYLTFGAYEEAEAEAEAARLKSMQYTKLVLGVISAFYAVNVKGVSIGGIMLKIPSEVWDVNGVGGTILDSGSSLTFLTLPAYRPIMAALEVSLVKFENLRLLDVGPLEYCFNSSGFYESLVPRLAFHFADGARFRPHVKSYVIDAAEGVKCLGFVSTIWPGASVIGNILQQNHLWEFDLIRNKLGFASSTCT